MSLLVPWLVFPLVLGLLCAGCGTLVCRAAGVRPAPALVLPLGYAAIVVLASFAVWIPGTAKLAAPAVAGLAAAGLLLSRPLVRAVPRETLWAAGAAVAVLLAYGAPVLASGSATFSGYVSLDDSATWFALTDRALESGRSIDGLAPSSYEATLDVNLMNGYPLGSLLPLGIGAALVGQDVAWVFQPYIAFLAALLALALFELARPLVPSPAARAVVGVVAAQPALLYSYAQWTGVKEVAAAALIALACGLGAVRSRGARGAVPVATAVAALASTLTPGGLVWLAGAAIVGFVALGAGSRNQAMWLAGTTAALMLPSLADTARFAWRGRHVLTSDQELGNLVGPLDPLQIVGIWPSGDFRFDPHHRAQALVLVAVAAGLALYGLVFAVRSRAWAPLAYVATSLVGVAAIAAFGSPWVDGKAFATASPAVLFAALLGCAGLLTGGRRIEAAVAVAAVAGGVLWSNALAYDWVSLAPRGQLAELESIGERFAGQGPALMTEYQPYGVRHFLRRLDPEGASELRRRPVPLRDGRLLGKGETAPIDAFVPEAVRVYRTLVLLRASSAAPPPFRLVERSRYYDVWQQPS